MKFIKPLSHFLKLRQHRRGDVYAVLGYPRSGTTMLSELVALSTNYYFDRNNIFPTSGHSVLHSHWRPDRFRKQNALYIVRNPKDVAKSLLYYSESNGLTIDYSKPLESRHICSLSWRDHVQLAKSCGFNIIFYELIETQMSILAEQLTVDIGVLRAAYDLLKERHRVNPHNIDRSLKDFELTHREDVGRNSKIGASEVTKELELYEQLIDEIMD